MKLDGMGSWLCWKCSSNICQIYGSNYLSFIRNVYVSRIFDVVRFFWLFHYIHMTWAAGQYFSALQPLFYIVEEEKANIISSGVLIQHHSNYTGQKKRRECLLPTSEWNRTNASMAFSIRGRGSRTRQGSVYGTKWIKFFCTACGPKLEFSYPKKGYKWSVSDACKLMMKIFFSLSPQLL